MNTEYNDAKTRNELTKRVAKTLIDRGLTLTTAESCTGGNLAAALCAQADTAEFYDIGVITFSDRAKQKMLGVRASTLEKYSAVSEQTVSEMSVGIREQAETDISIAISGYAGPEGGGGWYSRRNGVVCVEFPRADNNKTGIFFRGLPGRYRKGGTF